jgi:Leucine-rich repeat (LRR) protein
MFSIGYRDINYEDIIDDEKTMLTIELFNHRDLDDINNIIIKLSKFNKIKMSFILRNICLENIPESIFDLENIYELHLSINLLKTISPSISKLKNLEILYLDDNKFFDFLVTICKCKNLKVLNMNDCNLTTRPFCITKLTNLKELLIHNDFNEFPKVICKLKNLEYLSFSNYIKMPDSLYDLEDTNIDNHNYKKLIYRLKVIFIKSFKKFNYKIISKIIKY